MDETNHIWSTPKSHAGIENSGMCVRERLRLGSIAVLSLLIVGCALPPANKVPSTPSAEEISRQQRVARAQTSMSDGLKKYERGNFDEAVNHFLAGLDSGVLALPEQLIARKHMAFSHCLNGREVNCKEEFEKAIALDQKFTLLPAEAGHPIWGPVYRLARAEIELRQSGRAIASTPAAPALPKTSGEIMFQDAKKAYDDADYNKSIKAFHETLKLPLSQADQIAAHKFIAFSYCLTNRMTQCRAEFEPIFKIDTSFDLAPAEAGHPSWGPSFRAVKAKQQLAPQKK
jgi:tetratricopeptide (TPR) repeat protein